MKAAGPVRGVYHFARPSGEPGDAVGEAADFHAAVQDAGGLRRGDLPYVLDLESPKLSAGATLEWARRFVAEIRGLTGHHPILYKYPSVWRDKLGDPRTTLGCPLWIAHYETARPSVPSAWPTYAIWQHTQSGSCAGIRGACDMNRVPGGTAALARLAI